MTPLIQTQYIGDQRTVIIDGRSDEPRKTDGIVQLGRARQEESGYNWMFGGKIRKVIARNVSIQDYCDLNCLMWFIAQKIEIDFSKSEISPRIADELIVSFERLAEQEFKVVSGSKLSMPALCGDMRQLSKHDKLTRLFKQLGFETKLDS